MELAEAKRIQAEGSHLLPAPEAHEGAQPVLTYADLLYVLLGQMLFFCMHAVGSCSTLQQSRVSCSASEYFW